MAGGNIDDDDYVASLLKQDAHNAAKKYKMVGLDAFLPSRSRSGPPKPNTGFLRHLIRQTDNHNAALLAKEAEESQAQLKRMNKEQAIADSSRGRLTPPVRRDDGERSAKRKRDKYDSSDDDDDTDDKRRRKGDRRDYGGSSKRRDKHDERDSKRKERRESNRRDKNGEHRSKRSHQHREKERRREYSSDEDEGRSRRHKDSDRRHRRRRSYSRSSSRSRSRKSYTSSRHQQTPRLKDRSRSPRSQRNSPRGSSKNSEMMLNSLDPGSDSDPLEAIVGPLPPTTNPTVRSRGRGAHKANSMAMDARFSSTYNPSTDVDIQSDGEDDWGDALEALRDRQRWKQQGAERLKAVGFSEEQVKKWEKGDEKTEDDVQWVAKGERREWDRGKFVNSDGHVDLKANWGRLT